MRGKNKKLIFRFLLASTVPFREYNVAKFPLTCQRMAQNQLHGQLHGLIVSGIGAYIPWMIDTRPGKARSVPASRALAYRP